MNIFFKSFHCVVVTGNNDSLCVTLERAKPQFIFLMYTFDHHFFVYLKLKLLFALFARKSVFVKKITWHLWPNTELSYKDG